jgi:acyl-CoA synthetase (AMP-forming)/AMP-acid ligase II/3-hydroxymyristoyl/3-hydroxydecanoyl-(acyl carrier protein) dehydratase
MSVDSFAKLLTQRAADAMVCQHQKQWISHQQFVTAIQQQAAWLKQQTTRDYALFYESTYPFAISFFALLAAGKRIWIPGNNRPATAKNLQQQGCRLIGEWPETFEIPQNLRTLVDLDFDAGQSQLIIYTSGSTGQPKAIPKTLSQLEAEIQSLEALWGKHLADSAIAATVSHQHIYGLLFKLLWPLAAGRCFYSALYLSPEALLKAAGKHHCYWVASPAQLKRLDQQSPWHQITKLTAVFSSGGPLSETAANNMLRSGRQSIIEVYGSSETGGIAWRQQTKNPLWQPLPGVLLEKTGQITRISAPWLNGTALLDDDIELSTNAQFKLKGRRDNIIKIEEKRLSLTEIEHVLQQQPGIEQAKVFLLTGDKRDRLAAILSLNSQGFERLNGYGRAVWIKQLKKQLLNYFDNVMLPKKWLFLNHFPETAQGKIDTALLTTLLNQKKNRFPVIQSLWLEEQSVKLQIKIQATLDYFDGHFPNQPILPGVTQLAWADYYGHLFFSIHKGFSRMEAVKFKKTIAPETVAVLSLRWQKTDQKLYFELSNDTDAFGSGRMLYQASS